MKKPRQKTTGFYDVVLGKSLLVEKRVNITHLCCASCGKVLLQFTTTNLGPAVVIKRTTSVAFFLLKDLDGEDHAVPQDDTFGAIAGRIGMSREKLAALISENASVSL